MPARLPGNWRSRLEIVPNPQKWEKHGEVKFRLRFQDGRIPGGFDQELGYILVEWDPPCFVHNVVIANEYLRGRGLGKMLYEHALRATGMLSTRYHSSTDAAQRVWRSLIQRYPYTVDFFEPRLTIYRDQVMARLDKQAEVAKVRPA